MPRAAALPPADADRLMNYAEAAALLGVNVQTLRQQSRLRPADLRKSGPFADLAWFKLGTSVRIWRSALMKWIAQHQPEAEREPQPVLQVGLPPRPPEQGAARLGAGRARDPEGRGRPARAGSPGGPAGAADPAPVVEPLGASRGGADAGGQSSVRPGSTARSGEPGAAGAAASGGQGEAQGTARRPTSPVKPAPRLAFQRRPPQHRPPTSNHTPARRSGLDLASPRPRAPSAGLASAARLQYRPGFGGTLLRPGVICGARRRPRQRQGSD